MLNDNVLAASVSYTSNNSGPTFTSQMKNKKGTRHDTSVGPTSKFKPSAGKMHGANGVNIKQAYGYGGGVISRGNVAPLSSHKL